MKYKEQKERLEKEIECLQTEINSLKEKLTPKYNELKDLLIEEELQKYNLAEDKFKYLCFESTFDRGNISNSKMKFPISDLWRLELSKFLSTTEGEFYPDIVSYMFNIKKSGIDLSFEYKDIKEIHVQKVQSFIEGNWKALVEQQKEALKHYDFPLNSVIIHPQITDIDRGCELLVLHDNGMVKQYRVRYSLVHEICTHENLLSAYQSLKNGIKEEKEYYE